MPKAYTCVQGFVLSAAFVGLLLFSISPARAQGDALRDINPQRIADLSSPRSTLQSFLDLSEEAIEEWREDGATDRVYVFLVGLQDGFDFRDTVNGGSITERIRRILYLREILDRIDLPPMSDVPGADSLEPSPATWVIPYTNLKIERVANGARAGSYRFTAETVSDLDLTYYRVRARPYKLGAMPMLEDWEAATSGPFADMGSEIEGKFSRIDSSSPRAVLTSFLHHANVAYRISSQAEAQFSESPPTISFEEARVAEDTARSHLLRASSAFDLTHIPPSQQYDVRIEATLMLKEVLDRVPLPPIESVPDAGDVRHAGVKTAPFVWEYPGLPLRISRILEGDHAGSFAFGPRTLFNLEDTYKRLQDLSYHDRLPLRGEWEYGGDGDVSPGFYESYSSTPGSLVPSASLLSRFVVALPQWTKTMHIGQTLWQWIGMVVIAVIAGIICIAIRRAVVLIAEGKSGPIRAWLYAVWPLFAICVLYWATRFIVQDLNITGEVLEWFVVVDRLTLLALFAWFIWRTAMAVAASLTATPRMEQSRVDAGLIRILFGVLGIVASAGVVVWGLRDIGVDAVPLFAGLGVGGLAVALAIRPSLENLIGGIILHSDRPLRIGDFCSIGDTTGTIDSIGARSTKIRASDRTLITIPNARLADMEIVNWAHCDRMLITATLGLRHETTPDQMRHLLVKIRRMLHSHPKIDSATLRVRYAGLASSSREISVRIYALTHDWNEFYAIREDVFLRIDELVEASGTSFAFPSQTLYMVRDELPDAQLTEAAETEVMAWREAGEMPFPRLSQKEIDALEGTLDYPPKGSNKSVHTHIPTEEAPEPLSAGGHDGNRQNS